MPNITLSVTTITFDKGKNKNLSFYMNGKISNTKKIDNILVSNELTKDDFIYGISENFQCVIENSQTNFYVMKEIKNYQKKLVDETFEEISTGFENCVKSTYNFIYDIEGENEIEFSKDKLFSGILLKDNKIKLLSTNYNSIYQISDNMVNNCFAIDNKDIIVDDDSGDETEYAPSNGVMKSLIINNINQGDSFIFCTQNVNSKLSEEIIASITDNSDSSEEIAWNIISEISSKDLEDELIVMVVKILKTEIIKEAEPKSKFAGFFKNDNEDIEDVEEKIEEEKEETYNPAFTSESNERLTHNEFTHINLQSPGKMKRRMNIYLKRIISIIIVAILLVGIGIGMFKLITLIFDKGNNVEITPSPTISVIPTPTVSETPSPTPTPSPSLSPTPTPTPVQELSRPYTIQSGDSMWKISTMFYGSADYIDDIVAYNDNLTDANSIVVGQVIQIPFLNTAPTPTGPASSGNWLLKELVKTSSFFIDKNI